jgi:HlyD family secretion protein
MKIVVGMLVLLAVAAGLYHQFAGGASAAKAGAAQADAVYSVKKAPLKITVVENGYLKAKNSEYIEPKFDRAGTITWIVEEGKSVEKGDKLVEFEKTEVQNQIDELASTLIQNQAALEAARSELEIQKRDNGAAVEAAEFALKIATMKQERYAQGEGPNNLRKTRLAAEKAHSEFDRAKERFKEVPTLEKEGFLTKIQVEEERIRLRETEINMENADKDLELLLKYTDPMDAEQFANAVKDGERVLANAREKAEINLKEREARVASSERQVKTTQTRLDKLNTELANMTMTAPRAGIVHYGDPRRPWMREEIKVGEVVRRGNTLITLPDLREMQVLIQVHEADIDMVKPDMKVLVTLDAQKGRVFPAKVTQIASVADSDWSDSKKTFQVEITMDPIDIDLRAGITARCEIQVEEIPDVLQVPIHSVVPENGKNLCFVTAGAGFEQREVKIAKNNAHFVQVIEGLAEGDQILLYDPREGGAAAAEDTTDGAAPEDEAGSPGVPTAVSGAASAKVGG